MQLLTALGLVLLATGLHFSHRRRLSLGVAAILFVWAGYSKSVISIPPSLGVDSFSESQNFDLTEALFFLQTLAASLEFRYRHAAIAMLLLLFAFLACGLSVRLAAAMRRKPNPAYLTAGGAAVLLAASVSLVFSSYDAFRLNSAIYAEVRANFSGTAKVASSLRGDLKLFVYIGESTTSANMGLYGYFRPTTPRLSAIAGSDAGLLVFDNVLSTHSHTSPSLLQALSIGETGADNRRNIFNARRLSVVDLLAAAGIGTTLISNQGESGKANFASTVIFQNAVRRIFSTDSRFLGSRDGVAKRPFDWDFFESHLDRSLAEEYGRHAYFFHSYAGHGPYAANIPGAFRAPVDGFFDGLGPQAIFASSALKRENIEGYDSAMKYVDHAVASFIERIARSPAPGVFIYFSDHGESPYSGRGHDSARYIHEMSLIPFVVYFNAPARQRYPTLFDGMRQAASKSNPSTLDQFGNVLGTIYALELADDRLRLDREAIIGNRPPAGLSPIMARKTGEGDSYIGPAIPQAPGSRVPGDGRYRNLADGNFNSFLYSRGTAPVGRPMACYHRSNSIAKAYRGTLTNDCVEFDTVVRADGTVGVFHPPAEDAGLALQKIIKIADARGKSVWIDAKNIGNARNCDALNREISAPRTTPAARWLVEVSGDIDLKDGALGECLGSMRKRGIAVSFYIPTRQMKLCSQALGRGSSFAEAGECRAFESALAGAVDSGLFTDLSFEFDGLPAVQNSGAAHRLPWNTWALDARSLGTPALRRFSRVIVQSGEDPNSR